MSLFLHTLVILDLGCLELLCISSYKHLVHSSLEVELVLLVLLMVEQEAKK
jgi:hypothetical protein